jgi:magnesium transporter
MITIFNANKGKVVPGVLSDLQTPALTWCNMVNPSDDELEGVSIASKISSEELKKAVAKDVRPTLYESEDFYAIFFDSPSAEGTRNIPVGIFLLKNNNIVTICTDNVNALQKLEEFAKNNKVHLFQTQSAFSKMLLDLIVSDYFKILDVIEDSVDKTEEDSFVRPTNQTAKTIFENKKSLFSIHKSLLANREVVGMIEKEYISKIPKKDARKFRTVHDDLTSLIDVEETLRDISTGVLDVYLSSVSTNLNNTMKKMTAWGSLILVPSLIAGIYGMNFAIPEAKWNFGYQFALGLMIVSVIALYSVFKKKKYF